MTQRFNSLQIRLLVWLLVPMFFLSVAHIVTTYSDTRKASEKVFDKLLVTLALSISEQALSSGGDVLTDDLLEMIRVTTNDSLYYKVIGPDNAFVVGYEDIPSPVNGVDVIERQIEFYDVSYLGQAMRVAAVSTLVNRNDFEGWMTTFVAQTLNDREEFVRTSVVDNLWRLLLTFFVTATLFFIGIGFGLKPLRRLQDSVNRRDIHDLSPIKQHNLPKEIDSVVQSLNELLNRLSAQISLTKSFVENAAHQLRTPVSALIPQTELAWRKAESERERTTINKIKSSAQRIGRLTHQLLNLTYAESISLSATSLNQVDLAERVLSHINRLRDGGLNRSLDFMLDPAPIAGLPLLISEVIDNLLDNAIKYSDEDSTITIRTYCDSNYSFLEVEDNGQGISLEEREKVFERFYRADQIAEGSGLGLSIVDQIVSLHHGEVHISDGEKGVGTCIHCQFPTSSITLQNSQ